jgi:predicted nucleic acid-binding protein
VVLDLSGDELATFARLRDGSFVSQFSLVTGLGQGEAAALAIALGRTYEFATDDQDAIKVARGLAPDLQTHRIRALLVHAAQSALISREEARQIHSAMLTAGFWDRGRIE